MNLQDFQDIISALFEPEKLAGDSDEYGFTYQGRPEIHRMGYATNLTPETAAEAIRQQVDLILTHHAAWDFVYGMAEVCAEMLAEHHISHYFIHSQLDDADFGTSASLMAKLGGRVVEKSNPYEIYHWGRIGEFVPPLTLEELVHRMEIALEESVRAWKNHDRPLQRVAVTTGAGHLTSDLRDAVEHGVDAYVTGEKILYTVQYAHFAGLDLLVGSHNFTEIFGVESLALKIQEMSPGLEIVRLYEEHIE